MHIIIGVFCKKLSVISITTIVVVRSRRYIIITIIKFVGYDEIARRHAWPVLLIMTASMQFAEGTSEMEAISGHFHLRPKLGTLCQIK